MTSTSKMTQWQKYWYLAYSALNMLLSGKEYQHSVLAQNHPSQENMARWAGLIEWLDSFPLSIFYVCPFFLDWRSQWYLRTQISCCNTSPYWKYYMNMWGNQSKPMFFTLSVWHCIFSNKFPHAALMPCANRDIAFWIVQYLMQSQCPGCCNICQHWPFLICQPPFYRVFFNKGHPERVGLSGICIFVITACVMNMWGNQQTVSLTVSLCLSLSPYIYLTVPLSESSAFSWQT